MWLPSMQRKSMLQWALLANGLDSQPMRMAGYVFGLKKRTNEHQEQRVVARLSITSDAGPAPFTIQFQ